MQHSNRSPRLALALTLMVGAGSFVAPRALRAETVYLRDGRIVKGQVVERADGRYEITTKHGALVVDKLDIIRIEGATKTEAAQTDTVYHVDGRVFQGNVSWSDETKEVVISNEKGGETRIPRTLVKTIRFRQGKEAPSALAQALPGDATVITSDEDAEKKWRAQIDACLAVLRAPTSDDKERRKARSELLELGVFAIPYVQQALASLDVTDSRNVTVVKPVLEDVLRAAEVKSAVSGKMEEAIPGICEKLIDHDERLVDPARRETVGEATRKKALRDAVLLDPDGSPKLLLWMIQKDESPAVKALCVGQLSLLKRFEELASVLRMQENGQLRLVAALELGEAGIYVGIPVIIEALKLDGPGFKDVRTMAIDALKRYTNQGNLGYLPESDDKAERDQAVARWEAWWKAEGEKFARKGVGVDPKDIPDEEKTRAVDRWRDGNKVLDELAKKQEEYAKKNASIDPKEVVFAYETSAYLFKQALEHDPTLCSARISRAILLYDHLGRPREAESELKLVLNRYAPEDAKYLRLLATFHLAKVAERERDWKRAESLYLEVARLDPSHFEAFVGVGDSFFERAVALPPAPTSAPTAAKPAPAGADRKDIATNPVDAIKPASADATPSGVAREEGRPNASPSESTLGRDERDTYLVRAINHYKMALAAIDKKQRELLNAVGDLGAGDELESTKLGRLLVSIRGDRDSLVKRAAEVWFRLGRAHSARVQKPDGSTDDVSKREALEAFRAAKQLDPNDRRYAAALAVWDPEAKPPEPEQEKGQPPEKEPK